MTQIQHVYANCCLLEVAGDVVSRENVKTAQGYVVLNFEAAYLSHFRENQNPFA